MKGKKMAASLRSGTLKIGAMQTTVSFFQSAAPETGRVLNVFILVHLTRNGNSFIMSPMKLLFNNNTRKDFAMLIATNDPKLLALTEVYKAFDTPVDSLAMAPDRLAEFAAEMGRRGFPWTPEATLQELFRARQTGRLPRIRR